MSRALNRPNLIARGVMLISAAACVVIVFLLLTGGSSYVLKLEMANAAGLRPGSQVLLGGVPVGTVKTLTLNTHNVVIADLHLNKSQVHLGKGTHAGVVAANLLGEKYVALQPGNRSQPLRSGAVLPESATVVPTDLDQIVDVLDDPTRADLSILLNEAGIAVAGRQHDVGAILRQFPLSLTAATKLLTTMVTDNHTLGDLVGRSDQFIARINAQSRDLKRVIDSADGATQTFASRAGSLAQSIAGLPLFMVRVRDWFATGGTELEKAQPQLQEVAESLPPLDRVLKAVGPFTKSAVPTLNRAAAVAPTLTKLADRATPTIKLALPTLSSLSRIAKLAQPLSTWLGLSSSDFFNVFDGWSHAIQFRDGASHIFNGDLYMNAGVILNVADQGATAAQKRQNLLGIKSVPLLKQLGLLGAYNAAKRAEAASSATKHGAAAPRAKTAAPASPGAGSSSPSSTATHPAAGGGLLAGLGAALGKTVSGVGAALGGGTGSGGGAGSGGGTGAGSSSGNGSGASPGALGNLLSYLLGK